MTQAHQKFCRRILRGATAAKAYQHAFPKANPNTARGNGAKLLQKPHIQAELAALREKADAAPGSDLATHAELKKYLTRIIRAVVYELPEDSDLWMGRRAAKSGLYLRFPDKLRAITLLLKLLGPEPQPAPAEDPLTAMIMRIRNGTSQFQQQPAPGETSTSLLPRPTEEGLRRARSLPTAQPATQSIPPKAVESSPPLTYFHNTTAVPPTWAGQPQPPPRQASAPPSTTDPESPQEPPQLTSTSTPETPSTASPSTPTPPFKDPNEPLYRTIPPGYAGPPPFSARTDPRVVRPHPSRCVTNNRPPGSKAFIRHGKT